MTEPTDDVAPLAASGPWTNEELRDVALQAKDRYEGVHPPEKWEEPSEQYKRWLLDIGFTEEEVARWRSPR